MSTSFNVEQPSLPTTRTIFRALSSLSRPPGILSAVETEPNIHQKPFDTMTKHKLHPSLDPPPYSGAPSNPPSWPPATFTPREEDTSDTPIDYTRGIGHFSPKRKSSFSRILSLTKQRERVVQPRRTSESSLNLRTRRPSGSKKPDRMRGVSEESFVMVSPRNVKLPGKTGQVRKIGEFGDKSAANDLDDDRECCLMLDNGHGLIPG